MSLGWWKYAQCLGNEQIIEAAEQGKQLKEAKELCFSCAVRGKCLTEAMEMSSEGWFGGTSFSEREAMKTYLIATNAPLNVASDINIQLSAPAIHTELHI